MMSDIYKLPGRAYRYRGVRINIREGKYRIRNKAFDSLGAACTHIDTAYDRGISPVA